VLTGALSLHILMASLHLPVWECPFFGVTGLPCPGCGLTRACMLLLQGDVHAAVRFHAFAPIFIVLISAMMIATFLPKTFTEPLIHKAEILERRTGLTILILGGLILYWLARLLLFPTMFAQLIRG
jgi:predicted metal-binding membrane protein